MRKLKRLSVFAAVFLFLILVFNLTGYVYRVKEHARKDRAEAAYYVSASQQVLVQEVARKASVLVIHHYFSEEQYQQLATESRSLMQQLEAQQLQLKQLVGYNVLPQKFNAPFHNHLALSDSALKQIKRLVSAEINKTAKRDQDHMIEGNLRTAEATYLAAMKGINNEVRLAGKQIEASLDRIRDVMIASLVLGIVLLTGLLVVPVFRFHSKTLNELKATLYEVEISKENIRQSELKYRQLFQLSPMPMWIFDVYTLRFLEVNERTVEHYGYSREEFAQMSALDIRPERERQKLHNILPKLGDENEMYMLGKWIHQKKNGEEIIVEITTHKITYNGKNALLVLANDVTRNVHLQKELLETKINQQRQIAKAALSVQEKERNEIGKELHDNVNQILTSVKLHLELVEGSAAGKHLDKSIQLVNTAIQEIRRLSKSLVPPTFIDMGLITAIEDLIENMGTHPLIKMQFEHRYFDEDHFDSDFKLTIFRIIQEQITNVLKHAEAQNVTVHLQQSDFDVRLLITDDGKGFDKDEKKKGIGISNIKNRADAYGGVVNISSRPGYGCVLQAVFPITSKPLHLPEKKGSTDEQWSPCA